MHDSQFIYFTYPPACRPSPPYLTSINSQLTLLTHLSSTITIYTSPYHHHHNLHYPKGEPIQMYQHSQPSAELAAVVDKPAAIQPVIATATAAVTTTATAATAVQRKPMEIDGLKDDQTEEEKAAEKAKPISSVPIPASPWFVFCCGVCLFFNCIQSFIVGSITEPGCIYPCNYI